MNTNTYNQNDYPDVLLGFSTSTTIKSHGCAITAIGMLAQIPPDEVNRRLKEVQGYANTNLVLWSKLKEAIPWIEFVWRGYGYDDAKVKQAISDQGACLVEVDWDGQPATNKDKHWVLAIGNGQIKDPLTGKIEPFSKYPLPTGYAIIKRTGNPPEGGNVSTIVVDIPTWERIRNNSEKADRAVRALGLVEQGGNADNVTAETIEKSIAGKEGAVTACNNQLSTANTKLAAAEQEVKNRIEQLGRTETTLTKEIEAYKADIINLNQTIKNVGQTDGNWKALYEDIKTRYDEASKQKGEALNELAETKTKLELCQKNTKAVNILTIIADLLEKIIK